MASLHFRKFEGVAHEPIEFARLRLVLRGGGNLFVSKVRDQALFERRVVLNVHVVSVLVVRFYRVVVHQNHSVFVDEDFFGAL